MSSDPFSMIFDTLWGMAENCTPFTELVRRGNRIDYGAENDKTIEKKNIAEADLPEVVLLSTGGVANMWNSSSTSMVTKQYSWNITTGDLRINQRLHRVEWAIFLAMHDWKSRLTALKWREQTFVKRANIVNVVAGKIRPEANQQVATGWAAIWTVEVECHFPVKLIEEARNA